MNAGVVSLVNQTLSLGWHLSVKDNRHPEERVWFTRLVGGTVWCTGLTDSKCIPSTICDAGSSWFKNTWPEIPAHSYVMSSNGSHSHRSVATQLP